MCRIHPFKCVKQKETKCVTNKHPPHNPVLGATGGFGQKCPGSSGSPSPDLSESRANDSASALKGSFRVWGQKKEPTFEMMNLILHYFTNYPFRYWGFWFSNLILLTYCSTWIWTFWSLKSRFESSHLHREVNDQKPSEPHGPRTQAWYCLS